MSQDTFDAAAIVRICYDGNGFFVEQKSEDPCKKTTKLLPHNPGMGKYQFNWQLDKPNEFPFNFGPITVKGHIDTATLDFGVIVSVLGYELRPLSGNLKEKLQIQLHLLPVTGSLIFSLRDRRNIWLAHDLKFNIRGPLVGETRIFGW